MSPRPTRAADAVLSKEAVPASAVVEEVLRRTAQVYKELEELRWLSDHVRKLPDVTALWFTDNTYLNSSGNPLPLPLGGRGKSFSALIRRVFPDGNVAKIARSLVQSRAVRQRGRLFYALSPYVSFAEERSYAQVHSLDSVHRVLGTVQYNVGQRDPEKRLLERSASVDSIPVSALSTIHERIKREVGAMLVRLDNFMREHQVPAGSERTTTVIVGSYAAEDPMVTGGAPANIRKQPRPRGRSGSKP